jgi:exonuclease SbcC
MKIQHLKISQFAGIQNFETNFEDNLNVIFGANEAGKSSLSKALKFALFVPSNITNQRLNQILGYSISDFLPRGGGDSFRIELLIKSDGLLYQIKKSFGAIPSSEWVDLETGVSIVNPLEVQACINKVLGIDNETGRMNLSVWLDILFTNQASLSKTINTIKDKQDITNSLSELLTQLDGISPEELNVRLANRLNPMIGNWVFFDQIGLLVNRPRINPANGQGGVDNPWLNGNGSIINAYYAWKRAGIAKQARSAFEVEFDQIVTQIIEQQAINTQSRLLLDNYSPYLNVQAQRENLNNQIEQLTDHYNQMQNDLTNWIEHLFVINNQQPLFTQRQNELNELQAEQLLSNNISIQRARLNNDVDILQNIRDRLAILNEELAQIPNVTTVDFQLGRNCYEILQELNFQLAAQKLAVKLIAKKQIKGLQQCGINESIPYLLEKNEELVLNANTQFVLDTDELRLEISAGNDDVAVLHQLFQEKSTALDQILTNYRVLDFNHLRDSYESRRLLSQEIGPLERQFNDLLDGRNLDEMINQLADLNAHQVRPYETLQALADEKRAQIIQFENENNFRVNDLARITALYPTQQDLMTNMAEVNTNLVEAQNQLVALPTLPQEFQNEVAFRLAYEQNQLNFNESAERLNALQIARAERIGQYTDGETLFELTTKETRLEQEFNVLLEKGHTYLKIQKKIAQILEDIGDNPFGDLAVKVNHYLQLLTHGRYDQTEMNETTPTGIYKDGVLLENKLLSQGTADTLALATRLAMADYYLDGNDGLLLFDDPFTELDDIRKVCASQVLGHYAENKQVFVFTCHSNHKEMLGGNLVELA